MNIIVSVNNSYIKPLKVLIYSLIQNISEYIYIYMLQSETIDATYIAELKTIIGTRGNIEIIDVPLIECNTRFSSASLSRIIAPFYLPTEVRKALYLDADILVCGPIEQLFKMDMAQKTICAIPDYACDIETDYFMRQLNLQRPYHYVNSGVLLIDVDRFRKTYNLQKLLTCLNSFNSISSFIDQDFINDYFRDDIHYIDIKYNHPPLWHTRTSPVIIHFLGEKKPWHNHYNLNYFFKYKKSWDTVNQLNKLSVLSYIKNLFIKVFGFI